MRIGIPLAALALALAPLAVVRPVRVAGESMAPALKPGQVRWLLRSWAAGDPERFQVWLVDSPDEIDFAMVAAQAFPRWEGGPMFWADTQGLKNVRDKLAHYAAATGDANLKPTALIEKLAAEGGTFAGMSAKTNA